MAVSFLLALLLSQDLAAPPHPDIPAAAIVAAHVNDCIAATTAAGVDLSTLTSRGWTRWTVSPDRNGNALLAVFSKTGDLTVMSASLRGPRSGECMVMSPVGDPAGLDAIRGALDTSLAVQGAPAPETETVWITPRHRVTAARIGNPQAQGMRIRVTALERQ